MPIRYHKEAVTVDTIADGSATDYTTKSVNGTIDAIVIGLGTLATTLDLVITGESTGLSLLTQSNITASAEIHPAYPLHLNTTGAAQNMWVPVKVFNERVKIVAAQGGATKSGTVTFHWHEER